MILNWEAANAAIRTLPRPGGHFTLVEVEYPWRLGTDEEPVKVVGETVSDSYRLGWAKRYTPPNEGVKWTEGAPCFLPRGRIGASALRHLPLALGSSPIRRLYMCSIHRYPRRYTAYPARNEGRSTMKRRFAFASASVGASLLMIAASLAQSQEATTATAPGDTVHVAPPTGKWEFDRASILAALEQVKPGGTVRFAAGTYLVGEIIPIATPRLTLLGDPAGTTLRGCEAENFDAIGRAMVAAWTGEATLDETEQAMRGCQLLHLTGGHATIRNLTLEQAWSGLILGCCEDARGVRHTDGGYLIEHNIFRDIVNGVRGIRATG